MGIGQIQAKDGPFFIPLEGQIVDKSTHIIVKIRFLNQKTREFLKKTIFLYEQFFHTGIGCNMTMRNLLCKN